MARKPKVKEHDDEIDMGEEKKTVKDEPAPGAEGQVKGDVLPTNVPAGATQLKEASAAEERSEKWVLKDNVNHNSVLYRRGSAAPMEHLAHFKKIGVVERA